MMKRLHKTRQGLALLLALVLALAVAPLGAFAEDTDPVIVDMGFHHGNDALPDSKSDLATTALEDALKANGYANPDVQCAQLTMWVILSPLNTDWSNYSLTVSDPDDETAYEAVAGDGGQGAVYFTFETINGGSPTEEELKAGTYTAELKKGTTLLSSAEIVITLDDDGDEHTAGSATITNYVYVTLDLNYASSPDATVHQMESGAEFGTITIPTRSGYRFLGWFPNADGTGTALTAGTEIDADITYYAAWDVVADTPTLPSSPSEPDVSGTNNASLKAALAGVVTNAKGVEAMTRAVDNAIDRLSQSTLDSLLAKAPAGSYLAAETFFEIYVEDYSTGSSPKLVLDITPVYQIVALKAGAERLVVQDPKALSLSGITVTVPIPEAFAEALLKAYSSRATDLSKISNLFAVHEGWEYLTVKGSGTADSAELSFTADGFSEYALVYDEDVVELNFDGDYTVTVGSLSVGTYFEEESKSGYKFDGWSFAGISGTYDRLTSALLDKLVDLDKTTVRATPVFTKNVSEYTITASAGTGGTISPSGKVVVEKNEDQTFKITPNKGYEIADLRVDSKSVTIVDSYKFKDVTKDHTIAVTFKKIGGDVIVWNNPFNDINSGNWYYDAIQYVYEKNLFVGTTATTFSPNVTTTRATMVTVLHRAAGSPSAANYNNFADVPVGAWYTSAVAWAVDKGIVNGTGGNLFSPNREITREEMATMLYRYVQVTKQNLLATRTSVVFSDAGNIKPWAKEAVDYMYTRGILNGKGGNSFDPNGKATRAELAEMFANFMKAINLK